MIAARTEPDLLQRIEKTRRELLDLSARNRLINTPRGDSKGRKVEIIAERSADIFRLLVRERRALSFDPGVEVVTGPDQEPGDDRAALHLSQPDETSPAADGTPDPRHGDLKLQTRLTSERLQTRLLSIYYDAQTYEQEQGVSILYLALGFLKWYETPTSDKARYAPLLLVPVDLERTTAATRFRLKWRDEDLATNLSLQAKLNAEFGIDLPDVPDMDEIEPEAYFDAVAAAIRTQPRWEVGRNDMLVWFFSFAKYLMYRDLDPATWPTHAPLSTNPTLQHLLGAGFAAEPSFCGENDKIDPLIPPALMVHITDADSSQAVAIEEVRRGRSLVIQGPPGTGKSQTITNLIATAVRAGKKVLFVAEKMAALEVVHSRLEGLGLGAICLELHSSKASKKTVLAEIARTTALGRPKLDTSTEQVEALQAAIDRLNNHAAVLNTPLDPAGVTPYQIIGRLAHLTAQGIEPIMLPLVEPETWTGTRFRAHCRDLADLQAHLATVGDLADHPWRGVTRTEPLLPIDRTELQAQITATLRALQGLGAAAAPLQAACADLMRSPTCAEVDQLTQFAGRILAAPPLDRLTIGNPVWELHAAQVGALVEQGRAHAAHNTRYQADFQEGAWQTDLAGTRRELMTHGRSYFRWFRRDYRAAVATLRGIVTTDLPRALDDRLGLVDAVIQGQNQARRLNTDPQVTELGHAAFGTRWQGAQSDWPALAQIVQWDTDCRQARVGWNHRALAAVLAQPEMLSKPLQAVTTQLPSTSAQVQELARLVALDPQGAFGVESLQAVPLADLVARFQAWQAHPEALSQWIGYQVRRRRLAEAGLEAITAAVHEGRVAASSVVDQFQVAYYQTLIRSVFRTHRDLAEFDGPAYERCVDEFQALDRQRIELARAEVATAHFDGIPRHALGGEMAIIRREIEKKRKHKPIRQLIREAGTALLGIKPVFLMSPISVAQFLEPGSVAFDLLLIDEASQVNPVDALGAMARAGQVVVVGDDKQLPPSHFFAKMLDDDEAAGTDDDDDFHTGDIESILGLCVAQGMAQRLLRWHYRSRHHSLIAVSNREFYDNRLFVVPSPATTTARHGLHFRPVAGGVFDRGNSASNRVEARAIAAAVIDHARESPHLSLGVGAFSVAQRDVIRDELEVLLREHVEHAAFFATTRPNPFFIKNLENIQGDERDVIFISVGYARDKSGSMAMNFGPLSREGGERRLNVLISRARERCEVFSSITADDIDLERARSRGAAAFKTFLHYAATGILDAVAPTGGDSDSDFERQVAEALTAHGHIVHRQVGTAGFLIDLAVVDPVEPGRYLLGIECDGATYHSSRSARDRDRLREAVLRDRGWQIHRVWSTDWFHRPADQLRRIEAAIEQARGVPDAVAVRTDIPRDPPPAAAIERTEEPTASLPESAGYAWVVPYVEATLSVPSTRSIPETSPAVLRRIMAAVVAVEGPIHQDELARRITGLWGVQRTGPRIAAAITQAIEAGIAAGTVRAEADFVTPSRQTVVPVRNRSEVTAASLKKPEMLPPTEVRQAILHLVRDQVGLSREELPGLVSGALGFKVTSAKLKERVEELTGPLLGDGHVILRDDKLFLA